MFHSNDETHLKSLKYDWVSFFVCAAEYAGKPLIPPYLEPNADHSHGVNFGSGGAGVLVETNQGLVTHTLSHFLSKQRFLHLGFLNY